MSCAAHAAASVITARLTPRVRSAGIANRSPTIVAPSVPATSAGRNPKPACHELRGDQATDARDRELGQRYLARIARQHHQRQQQRRDRERHAERDEDGVPKHREDENQGDHNSRKDRRPVDAASADRRQTLRHVAAQGQRRPTSQHHHHHNQQRRASDAT
jgi:hypothetical protein